MATGVLFRSLLLAFTVLALFSSVRAQDYNVTQTFGVNSPVGQALPQVPLTDQLTQVTASVAFVNQVVDIKVCFSIFPSAPAVAAWEDNCDAFLNFPFAANDSFPIFGARYGVYRRSGNFRQPVKRATAESVLTQSVYLRNVVYFVFVSGNATVSLNYFIPLCPGDTFGPTCQTGLIEHQPFGIVQVPNVGFSVYIQLDITKTFGSVSLATLLNTTFITNTRNTASVLYAATYNALPIAGNEDYPLAQTLVLTTPAIGTWYVLVNSTVEIGTLFSNLTGVACPANKVGPTCNISPTTLNVGDVNTNPATLATSFDFYQFQITALPANFSVSVVYLNTTFDAAPQMFTQFNQTPVVLGPTNTNLFSTCNVGACTQTVTQQIIGLKSLGTFYIAVNAPLGSYIIWDSNKNRCPNCQNDGNCFAIGACGCTNDAVTADCSTPSSGLTTVQIVLISVASVIIAAVVVAVIVFAIFKCRRKPGYQSI